MSSSSVTRSAAPSNPQPKAAGKATADTRSLVRRLDGLPTLSTVAHKVGQMVADPESDAGSVARMLRSDQSLSASVLKLANSPYYSIPGGVTDVGRAISFLGFNAIHQLVLTVSVFEAFGKSKDSAQELLKGLWKHSLGSGAFAEVIARRLRISQPELFFSAGLLHDIGKVALLQVDTGRFEEAVNLAKSTGTALLEAERDVGLPTHDTVGVHLAKRWKFPAALRTAIEHGALIEPKSRVGLQPAMGLVIDITALAVALARDFQFGDPGDDLPGDLNAGVLERLNFSRAKVELIRDDLQRALERSQVFLELVDG